MRAYWLAIAYAAILVFGGVLSGCATAGMPANATVAQKMQADAGALQTIAKDVSSKCGQQFGPVGPVIASILSVAADPYNALNDVMAAIGVIPVLAQDYKGAQCVITTVRDDIHALFGPATAATPATTPAAKTTADMQRAAEMGEQVLALIDQGAIVTVANGDGGVQMSAETP